MSRARRRLPDFAGVALVDILANGVAMLIIVIVVSIATRVEQEERQAEQADEVAAVMSHKFSTSLVLNSLAASPPARLHDYETSPLDQVYDPELLPILELHPGFVREFYSGTIWTRRDLLSERSGLSAWLAGFSETQRQRLRIDVYGVAQFYLAMAILREHGVRSHHWHFLTGPLSAAEAARCPPGVAAKDCPGGGADETAAPLPQLAREEPGAGGSGAAGKAAGSDASGGAEWPPSGLLPEARRGPGGAGSTPGLMPGGVVPGIAGLPDGAFGGSGAAGGRSGGNGDPEAGSAVGAPEAGGGGSGAGDDPGAAGGTAAGRSRGFGLESGPDPGSAAALGSFPDARGGRGSSAGRGGGNPPRGGSGAGGGRPAGEASGRGGPGGNGSRLNLRIALPESIRRRVGAGGAGVPALEALFGAMLHYLGEMQDSLDAGGTPSGQIAAFAGRMTAALAALPPITDAEREIARDLALKFALLPHLGGSASRPDPLAVRPVSPEPGEDTVLVVTPNRLNDAVGVSHAGAGADDGGWEDSGEGMEDGRGGGAQRPGRERITLALNAYPGIWKGLELRLEPWSVLLMPPEAREPERTRWRAVAYVSPELDDVIIGFVFAGVDAQGRLRAQADANRVRLGRRPLFTGYRESAFGARGWLVSLYAALVAGLLLLVVARRSLAGRAA